MSNHNQAPHPSNNPHEAQELADIGIQIDAAGMGHRDGGKFISKDQLALIEANADRIRNDQQGTPEDYQASVTAAAEKAEEAQAILKAQKETAYKNYTNLLESGGTPDGPSLNKIGLSYTERIKMGYAGPIDTFANDAAAWKAEQEEAARRQAQHAESKAKADAWHAETKAMRDERQATDERVQALADGTAAVEGLSYKEKLEAGGDIGLRKKVEQSKMSEEEAIELAEAEGYNAKHRKPRVLEVATNTAAEERAREMVDLLNAQRPRATQSEAAAGAGNSTSTEAARATTGETAGDDEPADVEPVTALDEPSLASRLKKIWGKGRDKLLKLYLGAENRIVSPAKHGELSEKQLQRRRFILNGAIGAAVVYKTWATYNGMHSGGGTAAVEMVGTGGSSGAGQSGNQEVIDALTGNTSGANNADQHSSQVVEALTGQQDSNEVVAAFPGSFNLAKGDTIEGMLTEAAQQHGAHLSEAQIHELVSQTLQHNNLSWDDARELPVGFNFTVPDAVRAQLAQSS